MQALAVLGFCRQSKFQAAKLLFLKQQNKANSQHVSKDLCARAWLVGECSGIAVPGCPLGSYSVHYPAQHSHSKTVPEGLLFVTVRGWAIPYSQILAIILVEQLFK